VDTVDNVDKICQIRLFSCKIKIFHTDMVQMACG